MTLRGDTTATAFFEDFTLHGVLSGEDFVNLDEPPNVLCHVFAEADFAVVNIPREDFKAVCSKRLGAPALDLGRIGVLGVLGVKMVGATKIVEEDAVDVTFGEDPVDVTLAFFLLI